MLRIFIISENETYEELTDAQTKIQLAGFVAFCEDFPPTEEHKRSIKGCAIRRITECDGVYVLNNNTHLTQTEVEIAKELNMDFYTDEQLEEIYNIREDTRKREEKEYMAYLETL